MIRMASVEQAIALIEEEARPRAMRVETVALADAFDAMTSDRPYRKGMPVDAVLRELREKSGIQFDPQIVDVFSEAVRAGEVDLYLNGNGRRGSMAPPPLMPPGPAA